MDASMTDTSVDPKLSEAIKRWSDYASESAQNLQVLFDAVQPFKDTLQVSQQVMGALQRTDWRSANSNWLSQSVLLGACQELMEIQLAALEKESDCYMGFLSTTFGAGRQVAEAMQGTSSPQQLLASCLDASLNIAQQYQNDASKQVSTLGQVQSAYNAWLQKTLESLSEQAPCGK